jgi:hypothetical protein
MATRLGGMLVALHGMHVLLCALLERTYLSILCVTHSLTHSQTSFAPITFGISCDEEMMDDLGRKRETILIQEERDTHLLLFLQKISLSSLLIDPPLEKERRQNALTYLALLNKSFFTKRLLTLVKEWSLCVSNYQ